MEKNKIEEMIIKSLKETAGLILKKECNSKIIIPNYRDKKGEENKPRYSEQELKQIFLNQIENDNSNSIYYSVETPSSLRYRFKDKSDLMFLLDNESQPSKKNFQSSMIDVSLYDDGKKNPISHIEFKYGQCENFPIQKDFLKLMCEFCKTNTNYFVHYLSPFDDGTIKAILGKYKVALDVIMKKNIQDKEDRLGRIVVFVMFVDSRQKPKVKIFKIPLNRMKEFSSENTKGKDLEENICLYEVK